MSDEANLIATILQAGSTVELNATKWSEDSLRSFAQIAKRTGAIVVLRNLGALTPANLDKIAQLAPIGGKALHLDFSK